MLEIRSLSKTYAGQVEALKDVSLTMSSGIYGLLGPNGAGKSTLMRTLATLQTPDSGEVTFDGVDLLKEPHRVRRRLGYLPQESGVYPRVTAREMLMYVAGLKGIEPAAKRRDEVEAKLALVNLTDVGDQRLDTYSGGMRQRFGIAAAFLGEPGLVIVDEPTAGLDPRERRRFQHMLANASQRCVLILSSHIVEDIAGLCSRMALLHQGQVVLEGEPSQLVLALEGQLWTRLVEFAELDVWRERVRLLSWRPSRGRLMLRAWSEERPEEGFEPTSPDLEDLYALHTGTA
ncbi:MAG: ABC transporter ATP-binding protein [Myxococcota bacterium]